MTAASVPEQRLRAVDGLRGIAIVMVLIVHCLTPAPTSTASTLVFETFRWLWLGVDLFFVISGFLITRILLKSVGHTHYFGAFYARRALRILPASYFVLVVVFLLFPLLRPDLADAGYRDLWPYFFAYVQNWLLVVSPEATMWGGLNHTWSLAIEEQFYLVWPLVVWAVPRARRELLCLAAVLAVFVLKLSLLLSAARWETIFTCTFTRADGLLLGAWIAVVSSEGGSQYLSRRAIDVIGGASHGLLAGLFFYFLGTQFSTPVVAIVTPVAAVMFSYWLLVGLRATGSAQHVLALPTLRWFAKYSYGIYLIHWPVLCALRERLHGRGFFEPWIKTGTNWEGLWLGGMAVAFTCTAAVVMFHLLEKRFLNLKTRWQMPVP